MREIVLIFASLIILLSTGCKTHYGENWREISLVGATVMMPGEPKREQEGTITRFTLNHNSELYIASNSLMVTPSPDQIDQALDSVRNGFITASGAVLLEEQHISLEGFPGREFTYEDPKYNKTGKERMWLAKSILYQISVSWDTDKFITDDGQKFLDSFEIRTK